MESGTDREVGIGDSAEERFTLDPLDKCRVPTRHEHMGLSSSYHNHLALFWAVVYNNG